MAQEFQASFVQEGKDIDHTPVGNVSAGDVIVLSTDLVTIAKSDIASGVPGTLSTEGAFNVVVKNESIAKGVAVFWDDNGDPEGGTGGTGAATATGSAGPFMGWVLKTITAGDEFGLIDLVSKVSSTSESIDLADLTNVGDDSETNTHLMIADGDSWESQILSGAITITNTGVVTINPDTVLGASGTAGTLTAFASTAASGKFKVSCADQDADTEVEMNVLGMGQATVIDLPDPGAVTATILLTDQANDQSVVTATAVELSQLSGAVLAAMTPGSGITGTADAAGGNVAKKGPMFKTEIFIDLTGLKSASIGEIIGAVGAANCHIGQITAAKNGTIIYGQITCLETPAGGDPDVDFYGSVTEATGTQATAISGLTGEAILINNADWTGAPQTPIAMTALPGADGYLYMVDGGGTAVQYSAGQFLIELWGV